jgi:hypothetical protein
LFLEPEVRLRSRGSSTLAYLVPSHPLAKGCNQIQVTGKKKFLIPESIGRGRNRLFKSTGTILPEKETIRLVRGDVYCSDPTNFRHDDTVLSLLYA